MDIEKIKTEKNMLEGRFIAMIAAFEKDTGMIVTDIEVDRFCVTHSDPDGRPLLKIKAELP